MQRPKGKSANPGERLSPSDWRVRDWLAGRLADALGATRIMMLQIQPLEIRAAKENWLLDCEIDYDGEIDRGRFVLRAQAAGRSLNGHGFAEEMGLLGVLREAGVAAPRPVLLHESQIPLGRPFWVMSWLAGVAAPELLVQDPCAGGNPEQLAMRIATELARLHAIVPPRAGLGFLGRPGRNPIEDALIDLRTRIVSLSEPRPVLAFALDWLAQNIPQPGETVLCHRDLRVGSFRASQHGLSGLFDWERAGWSDPHEDVACFCARTSRGGRDERPAGGLASREAFIGAYEKAAGRALDPTRLRWWEVAANLRAGLDAVGMALPEAGQGAAKALGVALEARAVAVAELELLDQLVPDSRAATQALRSPPHEGGADRPGAAEIVGLVRAVLLDELIPNLPDAKQASARLAARALSLIGREASVRNLPRNRLSSALAQIYGSPVDIERFTKDILAGYFRPQDPRHGAAVAALRIAAHDRAYLLDPKLVG